MALGCLMFEQEWERVPTARSVNASIGRSRCVPDARAWLRGAHVVEEVVDVFLQPLGLL